VVTSGRKDSHVLNRRPFKRRSAVIGLVLSVAGVAASVVEGVRMSQRACAPIAVNYDPTIGGRATVELCAALAVMGVPIIVRLEIQTGVGLSSYREGERCRATAAPKTETDFLSRAHSPR
jgi:hypothetical protein